MKTLLHILYWILDGEIGFWEKVGNITNLLIYVGTKKDEIRF